MWDDLVRVMAALVLLTILGIPAGLLLGYFVNPWWYLLAIVASIPGILSALNRLGFLGEESPIVPPPPPKEPD